MSNKIVEIGGVEFDFDSKGNPVIWHDGGVEYPALNNLGSLSEWLAVAWENIAGEQYKPVSISEGGYVTDKGAGVVGVVHAGEHVIPKAYLSMPGLDRLENLERDCE